jgi:galactokinase
VNGSPEDPRVRARSAFRGAFGSEPRWGAAAPGRVNLIGEHTDYNDGFVLPMAIDRVCVAVGGPAADPHESRILAVDLGETVSIDLSRPLEVGPGAGQIEQGSWPAYIAGVAARFQRLLGGSLANLDIAVASSVPVGGGLSSSAAIEVATSTLLEQATGITLEPKAKALLCQRAEHEFAGVPCGIMDQFVSVMGREGHALLIDCRSQVVEHIPMPRPEHIVVLILNSNVRHSLAAGEYAKRKAECQAAVRALGIASLRDADEAVVVQARAHLSDVEFRRARHVVSENARTVAAAVALRGGDLAGLGRLMIESHRSLRDDYEVSCAELDTLVELAEGTEGVFGARMTGGGFGGCVVALVSAPRAGRIAEEVGRGYRARHGRDLTATQANASAGAAAVAC